ncbi:UEV-domain-containing protein [Auriculariales sp. MPI-PUGE-AT-0066]|nr:UEV-domain-containing protein [Auriculariales sp. MPI-PUGE-AT-0066]
MAAGVDLSRQWLRQVVQPYPDSNRVYADIDAALATYATLRPKTEMYTFNDGRIQLLICVHGLIPISYRQSSYNIPVSFWIPHAFPREPPMAFVVPTSDMFVRASKSVDPSGRCDVEYLQNWERKSEGCDFVSLIKSLQDHFSREPPLYAKQKPAQATPVTAQSPPPATTTPNPYASRPPPSLPGTQSMPVTTTSSPAPPLVLSDRPALPAKPGVHPSSPTISSPPAPLAHPAHMSYDSRPPPSVPPQVLAAHLQSTQYTASVPRPPSADHSARPASAYGSIPVPNDSRLGPPHPPMPPARPPLPSGPTHSPSRSVDSRYSAPAQSQPPYYSAPPIVHQHSGTPGSWPATASPLQNQWQPSPPPPPPVYSTPQHAPIPSTSQYTPQALNNAQRPPPPPPVAPIPPPAAAPVRSLIDEDDEPSAGPSNSGAPAPPRPPNPELMRLHAAVHTRIHAELGTIAAAATSDSERLRMTQEELLQGEPAIRDEMARLEAVRDVCRTVSGRLREVVGQAEANVAELRRKGDPEVDELVCSTSIVHNQLINLVAEDNAIEDTMYHLHRALNAGRVDLDKFLKTTRALAEEQFTKRVLIDRITEGLAAPDPSLARWT